MLNLTIFAVHKLVYLKLKHKFFMVHEFYARRGNYPKYPIYPIYPKNIQNNPCACMH